MATSRASTMGLSRLLDQVEEPVYVVSAQRRIVYFNAAAGAWLGPLAGELAGQECQYHSLPNEQGRVAPAAALCPPPEAFLGVRAWGIVSPPLGDAAADARQFEFLPLSMGFDEPGAVLAVGSSRRASDDRLASLEPEASAAELHAHLLHWRSTQKEYYASSRLAGNSPAMRRVRAQVALAAAGSANVLVVGPPGSGRQHVARSIHYGRPAAALGPLVPLACSLLGAELLQTTIRALARQKAGASGARGGTLLLNDADQMPVEAQAELAGFLRLTELPVRIVATAQQTPAALLEEGKFRRDLVYALGTLVIELPPLAERVEDLPLLAQALLEEVNARGARQLGGFTPEALDHLAAYEWPGQVAELAAVVAEAHARADGPLVALRDLPSRLRLAADAVRYAPRGEPTVALEKFLADIERELIERALARAKGNKTRAARLLGMTRPRLYRRLVQLGFEVAQEDETQDGGGLSAEPDEPKMG